MKTHRKVLAIVLSIFSFIILPALVQAVGEPRLRLTTNDPTLTVNQQTTVDIFVEDAADVYGTELQVLFDPEKLEVLSLSHGGFLTADPENDAFVLENKADNQAGTINYALSLLNPALPVDGTGLLLQVTFQTKAAGSTLIQFEEGLFGTQTGEEIAPKLENIELTIVAGAAAPDQPALEPGQSGTSPQPVDRPITETAADSEARTILGLSLVLGAALITVIGLLIVAFLFGIWFWLNHARRKNRVKPTQA